MTQMTFGNKVQYSFWGNVDYPSNDAAKAARDSFARDLKKDGWPIKRSMMQNQTRQYGLYAGTGNVYQISVEVIR